MTENGHAPDVLDLGAILEQTRPARTLRFPAGELRPDSIPPFELMLIGRTANLEPDELAVAMEKMQRRQGGWDSIELLYVIAWVIARRVEPGLTFEEAKTFGLELPEAVPIADPTQAVASASRRPGTTGRSTSTAGSGSRPKRRAR